MTEKKELTPIEGGEVSGDVEQINPVTDGEPDQGSAQETLNFHADDMSSQVPIQKEDDTPAQRTKAVGIASDAVRIELENEPKLAGDDPVLEITEIGAQVNANMIPKGEEKEHINRAVRRASKITAPPKKEGKPTQD